MAVDDRRGEVDRACGCRRGTARAASRTRSASSMAWRSIRMPLARSIRARRPNAPWRSWYSAKRRSTMSIALCQSSTSASLMWAKTPRLDASLMNPGRARGAGRSPGRRLPARSCRSAPSACSELSPSPTSATSGAPWRSQADVRDVDLARDHLVAEPHDDRSDERQAVLALVGDQDAQMFGLAGAHDGPGRFKSSLRDTEISRRPTRVLIEMRGGSRTASTPRWAMRFRRELAVGVLSQAGHALAVDDGVGVPGRNRGAAGSSTAGPGVRDQRAGRTRRHY